MKSNTSRKAPQVQIATSSEHAEIERLHRLAQWMDSALRLPGTSIRIGLDPLISLIPGFGDAASSFVSVYIVIRAARLGASPWLLARMLANILADTAVGSLPLLGDLFDCAWKANSKNVVLLENAVTDRQISPRTNTETGRLFTLLIIGFALLLASGIFFLGMLLVRALRALFN